MDEFRIGQGYDVHRLTRGRRLILGGVEIPHEFGLMGHSDADVLTHAVIDALLGASGSGDIGTHFPDSDSQYKDIDSLVLLKLTCDLLKGKQFEIINIDATIIAQKPRMSAYIQEMRNRISSAAAIRSDQINIKATTEETLGFTGREEGISAQAIALLRKISS